MENPLTSVQLCLEPIKFLFVFLKLASSQDDLFQFYFQVPPRGFMFVTFARRLSACASRIMSIIHSFGCSYHHLDSLAGVGRQRT